MSINVGMSGRAKFELIDLASGQIEQTFEQHNLILDSGLEAFGVALQAAGGVGSAAYPVYGEWRRFFAVGTGSTAPAVTQTALVNQVQIAQDNGGFGSEQTETYSYDSVAGVYRCITKKVCVLNFTGSFNLTEWGLARNNTGSLSIRELFRDGVTNEPVVISVTAGKQLKITHTLTLTLPSVLGPMSFDITGLGIRTATGGPWAKSDGISRLFAELLSPNASGALWSLTNQALPTPAQAGEWFRAAQAGRSMTVDAYVGLSRKFTKRLAITTADANGTLHVLLLGTNTTSSASIILAAMIIKFDAPITKTASNTLSLVMDVAFNRA